MPRQKIMNERAPAAHVRSCKTAKKPGTQAKRAPRLTTLAKCVSALLADVGRRDDSDVADALAATLAGRASKPAAWAKAIEEVLGRALTNVEKARLRALKNAPVRRKQPRFPRDSGSSGGPKPSGSL